MRIASLTLLFATLSVTPISAVDFATRTMEATYKVFNKDSTATGFFVSDPVGSGPTHKGTILVTATHVLSKATGESAIIVLRKPAADGSYTRHNFTIAIRAKEKPLWTAHPREDVAALRVKLPADANVSPLPWESLVTEQVLKDIGLHVASPLCAMGFPTRFEANRAGFPIARHGSVASFPVAPITIHKTLLVDFTTFSGDSGGAGVFGRPTAKGCRRKREPAGNRHRPVTVPARREGQHPLRGTHHPLPAIALRGFARPLYS